MTKNQIDYYNAKETNRHNLAEESETNRSNVAKEQETYRSNLAKETETNRSNVANEGIALANLSETKRSHKSQERETKRANKAREKETARANKASEALTASGIEAQIRGQDISASNAATAAQASIAAAQISGNATVTAAKISAAVQEQLKKMDAEISKYVQDAQTYRTKLTNQSNADIAAANRLENSIQKQKDRLNDAILTGQANNINAVRNDIEKLKAQIQKEYNEGSIDAQMYRNYNDAADTLLKYGLVYK